MERQITQSEVQTAASDALRNDMYHCYPGAVVSYDAAQETATIQPMTNDVRFDIDTGARISEPWQEMQGVPVAWPRFGGFVIKGSLAQFDPVILMAFDLDPSPWRAAGRTLKPVDPGDTRRHGGGYWFAFPTNLLLGHPGASSTTGKLTIGDEAGQPLITIDGSHIQLGATGGDFLALASVVDKFIQTVMAWVPAPNDGGAALKMALTSAGFTIHSSAASALVKAQ